jgi:acyl-CoA thioesterase FadM
LGGETIVHEDEYTIIEDVVGPGPPGDTHHLVDYQTQELVSTLWSKYLARAREGLAPSPAIPAMRRVSYSLDNEAFAGQSLQRGIKVVGRSRRSTTFAAGLWHPEDGRMVHAAEIVTVFVEPGKGSVEIPADFWAAVEQIEGRSIPVAERPA